MPPEKERQFDPTSYLTEYRGRKYLEGEMAAYVLRAEHPDAIIDTEEVEAGEDWVKFRARVTLPEGGSATGHARQTSKDFPTGWYEKCETRALGRALVSLGYGTQFATEFDEDSDAAGSAAGDAPIEFPRGRPRPVRQTATPGKVEESRPKKSATWNDFWAAVREYERQEPGFTISTVVGPDPARSMSAEEALRRFRAATTATTGEE